MQHPSWRPPTVAQLTAEAKQVVTVLLSEETRALNATLTRSLSDIANLRLTDVLTQEDKLLIAWANELASAEGIDASEVTNLVRELGRYRAQELAGQRAGLAIDNTGTTAARLVSLPSFTPREEAQARAILFGMATTQGSLDAGFVRTLLEPQLRSERSVSLSFLQRMVAALPPGSSDGVGELDTLYARRDARVALAGALDKLALPVAELTPSVERVLEGAELLRARAPQLGVSPWTLLTTLTRNDRALVGLLYASQAERGGNLRVVDDVTRSLVAFRNPAVATPERAGLTSGVMRSLVPSRGDSMLPARASVVPAPQSFVEATEEPVLQRGYGSAMQLAAKAAVAYRSVAPPRPTSVPPPALRELPIMSSVQRGEAVAPPPFNLVQALGLSALVAEAHTQAMRARRRRLRGKRELEVDAIADMQGAYEPSAEAEHDPTHDARRHARWRRLARRRSSSR
ncbi:MAG: hypothetical protein ABW352_01365 [Polyangiales bacterium]